VRAAVQQADDVYRYTMDSLDSSQLGTIFGTYLAAVDARQVAAFQTHGVHLRTAPGTLVIQQVIVFGRSRAIATGYKTESAVLVDAAGSVVRDYGTYTVQFTDALRRVDGNWRVVSVG
jgi:hypothetical protein